MQSAATSAPTGPVDLGLDSVLLANGQLHHAWDGCLDPAAGPHLPEGGTSAEAMLGDARQFLGQSSDTLVGRVPYFQAAGGATNDCSDFVSSMLKSHGRISKKEVNVDQLKHELQKEGYKHIKAKDARPGDVAFYKHAHHTELITEAGGTRSLGSNNENPANPGKVVHGHQWITEHKLDPDKVTIYAKRPHH